MLSELLFISGPEIFVVILVVLLLFGSKRIPEMAKGLGKGMREFKKAADDIREEFDKNTSDVTDDIKEMKNDINEKTSDITKNVKDFEKKLDK